jgi:hypothetical protein
MHHFGEDAVQTTVSGQRFFIVMRHHTTGAEVHVNGPIRGVFEQPDRVMTTQEAEHLGRELVHVLRRTLV